MRATWRLIPGKELNPIDAYDLARWHEFLRLFLACLLVAVYATAGATLIAPAGGGLQWLPLAFLLAVTIAASNAWILLVEVLR